MIGTTLKMKKGTYYIGDPCYLFDKSWSEVLNETGFFSPDLDGECFLRGKLVAAGSTAHGDGSYKDNEGRGYWVDSGMIGILPISLEKIDNIFREGNPFKDQGAHVIKFDTEFTVEISDGIFKFGSIVIDTKNDPEDEEE